LVRMWSANLIRRVGPFEFELKSVFLCSCEP
jgi:hypothetical protein